MLPETTNFKLSIFMVLKKIIYKWLGVSDFWEGQMEKQGTFGEMPIFQLWAGKFPTLFLRH